jgi:hypothetical protein
VKAAALLLTVLTAACAQSASNVVSDPALCRERTEVRLKTGMDEIAIGGPTYTQLIFDNRYGDQKLLRDFMWQNGYWPVANAPGTTDFGFIAGTDATKPPFVGDPNRGIELACRGSWLSKVPFLRAEILSKQDSTLLKAVQAN